MIPQIPKRKRHRNWQNPFSKSADTGLNFINVKLERLDEMMRLVSELVTIKAELNYRQRAGRYEADGHGGALEKVTTRFRDNAFTMRWFLCSAVAQIPAHGARFGRDSRQGHHILTEGLDTEIDKNHHQRDRAPLMHIIRNAIDHGLETAEEPGHWERTKGFAEDRGLLRGANVFIQVQDDGRGLTSKKIREKAIAQASFRHPIN